MLNNFINQLKKSTYIKRANQSNIQVYFRVNLQLFGNRLDKKSEQPIQFVSQIDSQMGKKLLKIQMQKQTQPIKPKSTRTLRSNKIRKNSSHDKSLNDIGSIIEKMQILNIDDESQTKDESVEAKRCLKKSISKSKTTKKSQQKKTIKKQHPLTSPQYQKLITTVCSLHLKDKRKQGKHTQKDLVNFEWFDKITTIWSSPKDKQPQTLLTSKHEIIKKTNKITYLSELTSPMLKRLKPKHWLNDQVVNSYIQLIELDMIKKGQINNNNTKSNINTLPHTVHLVQSYFATLKANTDKLQRQIKKRGFKQQSTIIIPINGDYHWFFAIISNRKIFICDSILPKNISQSQTLQILKKTYSMKQTLKKCFQLYEMLYHTQQFSLNDLHVITGFPQQDNQNDCGMMMLCGIKDVVTKFQTLKKLKQKEKLTDILLSKEFWNFCQEDIKFLRFLFTRQLLEERIILY